MLIFIINIILFYEILNLIKLKKKKNKKLKLNYIKIILNFIKKVLYKKIILYLIYINMIQSNNSNINKKSNQNNFIPNYQVSGIEPNYSYANRQNLPFDQSSISTSGYPNQEALSKAVEQQQNFVNNYNNYNPLSTFDRIETNSSNLENLRSFSQYNIDEGFKINKPIQLMPDTKNKHETLYDNLNENLLKESLKEYRLNIDSIDRDVTIYPDPFNYVVYLGPVTNSGINATAVSRTSMKDDLKAGLKNLNKKNKQVKKGIETQQTDIKDVFNNDIFVFDNPNAIKEYTINLERSFNPFIIRDFTNVSYVKLDCAVIPKYTSICINEHWDFCRKKHHKKNYFKDEFERIKDYIILNDRYIPNEKEEYNPLGDRFIQIFITELQSIRNFGTNPITDKSFLLIYDKTLGALYLKLIPYSATKTYKDSLLGNLTRLTIQFFDSWGNPLKINTNCIDYEIEQISETNIIQPEKYNIDELIEHIFDDKEKMQKCLNNFNQIIKCFIMINHDIKYLIPYYVPENLIETIPFHEDCLAFNKITINEKIFDIKNLYKELDSFVSPDGFIEKVKISKNNKKIKLTIDEYLNNVIWYDFVNKDAIINNMRSFDFNYRDFGFKILDMLKTEITNIPVNRNFQNFLTFLVGVWEDELNTKIDYTN